MKADLSQLRDLHLPKPVSVWPLAPGYYLLFFIAILVLVVGFFIFSKFNKKRKLKKAALNEVLLIEQKYHAHKLSKARALQGLSILIRRLLLIRYKRETVAKAQGEAFLSLLNNASWAKQLQQAVYQKHPMGDIEEIFCGVRKWIKRNL